MSKYDLLNPEQKEGYSIMRDRCLFWREPDPERREC